VHRPSQARVAKAGANLATSPEVRVKIATLDGKAAGTGMVIARRDAEPMVELAVPVTLDPFRAWSPEQPNLYRADIRLKMSGQADDGWVERFGVRKWEVRGEASTSTTRSISCAATATTTSIH